MNSLRARLILGVSLLALVPLAIGMGVMSYRFERTLRDQAAARLGVALAALRDRLASDGSRMEDQLAIFGHDPSLKRLVLLRPAGDRDLPDYLAQQRFLLGLDFLSVADTTGILIADAAPAAAGARADESAWNALAARPGGSDSLSIDRLGDPGGLVLTARAVIPYEGIRAGTVIGGRAIDRAVLGELARTSGVELVLRNSQGRIVAGSIDDTAAVAGATLSGVRRIDVSGAAYLARDLPLDVGPPPFATITGLVPTAAADATVRALQVTAILLGLFGLAIAILLGALWSSQVSRPVERLAAYSDRLARGEWDEPLELASVRELETLVASLESLRTDLRDSRARLVVSERHAAWSQMARKVAHEVKNPLTPIAISVADLRRSFELHRDDFPQILEQATRTISEEVDALKRMLNEFSEFARLPSPRYERCDIAEVLAGLAALYAGDVAAGRLRVGREETHATLEADPAQLRQVLVNLVKNGLEASGDAGPVTVSARCTEDMLEIAVDDSGPGLSAEQRANLFVPGFTTKSQGSGLGLTIVERIVSDHHGMIAVDSPGGRGTTRR